MLPPKLIESATLFFSKGMKLVPIAGKVPQQKDWPNRAVDSIESFMPLANAQTTGAALLCGPHSGVYVLDIDPRNDGFSGLQVMEERFGKLPETVTVETGGGGLHLYFRCSEPIEKRPALFSGVDGQFKNSLVVIPGSLHSSGKSYQFREGAPVYS